MAPSRESESSLKMTVLIHFQNQDHVLSQNLWGTKEDLTKKVLTPIQMCNSKGNLQGTVAMAAGWEPGTKPWAGSVSSLVFGVSRLARSHATSQKFLTGLKCTHDYRVWTSIYLSSHWIPRYFLLLFSFCHLFLSSSLIGVHTKIFIPIHFFRTNIPLL